MGQLLQIGTDLLQIGAVITSRGNFHELVHNNVNWKQNFYLKALENSQRKNSRLETLDFLDYNLWHCSKIWTSN